jgi:hypothetical protein
MRLDGSWTKEDVVGLELVREFAGELVKRRALAVDVSIHEPGKEGDHRNHHAHILCSTRRLGAEGFTEKSRELDDRKSGEVEKWRTRWAELCNRRSLWTRTDNVFSFSILGFDTRTIIWWRIIRELYKN